MIKKIVLAAVLLYLPAWLIAQSKAPAASVGFSDSSETRSLQEVVVKAYAQNRRLSEVAAPVSVIGQKQLQRFSNISLLPALNTIPGVRMEERSPGSYRLNIRGSSLRSPFGVRDIKIYWNDIPLTDPGGNTYLNQLGYYNFQSLEVIKGAAGSLYGAGIGGALLIRSVPTEWQRGVSVNETYGSFASNSLNMNVRLGDEDHRNSFSYTHQTSDGYRQQTQMRRDIASWETLLKASEKQTLHAYILYGDLYYQTPGALTKAEYNANPRSARPPAGSQPGAVQNKAAIFQKNFTAGFSQEYHFNEHWQNTTAVYGAYTDFTNPGIRVYERRAEPHFGGRSVFQYNRETAAGSLQLNMGVEAQKGFFNTKDYANKRGAQDTLQTDDNTDSWQYMLFAQGDMKFHGGWILTAGASFNKSSVSFTRVSVQPPLTQNRTFENKLAPRVALLKKILPEISLYASAARGFSTPTVAELLKSSGIIGNNLQPEDGIDYEVGTRGSFLGGRLYYDVNVFFFHLKNTIVQRIDTNGISYSVNAGSTRQNGIETYLSWLAVDQPSGAIHTLRAWVSHTWHDFHYVDFRQLVSQTVIDYSGHRLPSVPPQSVVAGLDILLKPGLYADITYTYSDAIVLNDAGTDRAGSYNLLGARIGFRNILGKRCRFDLFTGADNLFNTKYSLGNDINAAAGRYYNAAPGVNYFAGISCNIL